MSTNDVPGFNPAHKDVLAQGCWAEHEDNSLIFVKSVEGGRVIYEIYDMAQDPPVYYQDAMREDAFKQQFSWSAGDTGIPKDKWTWHDKTVFPWDRVIQSIQSPLPQQSSAVATLSAAARVAESLKLRAQELNESVVGHRVDRVVNKTRSIADRLKKAFDAFKE